MAYYEKYDVSVLLTSLFLTMGVLFFSFRKYITSIIDPIVLHFIWFSSCMAIIMGFIYKHGVNANILLFTGSLILYAVFLFYFLKPQSSSVQHIEIGGSTKLIFFLYLISTVLTFYSKIDFIIFASKSTFVEWFLYRFVLLEGRNPTQYIFRLGAFPFFCFFSFVLIINNPKVRFIIIFILVINLFVDVLSGGRSSILNFIFAIGTYFSKFSLGDRQFVKKLNTYGSIMIIISLFVAISVTSLYKEQATLQDGSLMIFDRVISAGDGLDMYLTNNADKYLDTGLIAYLKSALGLFLGKLFDVDTKSIGWRLYEIDSGMEIDVAAGPNYILPLQVAILGYMYLIPYTLLIAYCVAKMRILLIRGTGGYALCYALAYNCFTLLIDIEYATLIYVSIFFVYFLFIYPVCHIRIRLK